MLRETDPPTTIWEQLLPEEAKRLPAELQAVGAYLDDERFIAPWRGLFSACLGRPLVPSTRCCGCCTSTPLRVGLRDAVQGSQRGASDCRGGCRRAAAVGL